MNSRADTDSTRAYIAINDLLVYGSAITRPTGIQRVASGLAKVLVDSYNAASVSISAEGIRVAAIPDTSRTSVAARLAEPALRILSLMPRRFQELLRTAARLLLARAARSAVR